MPAPHGFFRAGALMQIRKWLTFSEESLTNESGQPADGPPLHKLAVAAVVDNPYAGRFSQQLDLLTEPSRQLGAEFGRRLVALLADSRAESYGKACIVGLEGEYEHGNALLTTAFADPLRDALGGGKAWISSTGKRGAPGTTIDVPLAHKDALYVRSHYDTMTLAFSDAPAPREIVVIFAVATRGRLHARLGGLKASEVKGQDGLR
jgi:Amino acid synthesis